MINAGLGKGDGIYGHFYHGMDVKTRNFTLSEYKKNTAMVKEAEKKAGENEWDRCDDKSTGRHMKCGTNVLHVWVLLS